MVTGINQVVKLHNLFTLKVPKWPVNVVCVEQNRGDGSYMYEFPMILDDNGMMWGGVI